jgi:hypothetical protein
LRPFLIAVAFLVVGCSGSSADPPNGPSFIAQTRTASCQPGTLDVCVRAEIVNVGDLATTGDCDIFLKLVAASTLLQRHVADISISPGARVVKTVTFHLNESRAIRRHWANCSPGPLF